MRYPLRVSTVGQRYGVVHAGLVSKQHTYWQTMCGRELFTECHIHDPRIAVTCRACLARLKREGE